MLHSEKNSTPGQELFTTGLDLDEIAQWDGCKEHVDVWLQHVFEVPANAAYFSTDIVCPGVLHGSGFHADILRPLDIEYSLGGITDHSARRMGFFAVYRSARAGPYTERDKHLYRLLIPHVRRALMLGRQLALAHNRETSFRQALDCAPFGIVGAGVHGRALVVNAEANRILSAGDGITLRSDRIKLSHHEQHLALERMIAEAIQPACRRLSTEGGSLSVQRSSGKRSYQILICPLPDELDGSGMGDGGACLVLMHDPEQPAKLSADLLRRWYGMTMAEARLCAALMECASIDDVVERFGISRNTAKTQLAHVFAKVGVRSQTELLRDLALGLARSGFLSRQFDRSP